MHNWRNVDLLPWATNEKKQHEPLLQFVELFLAGFWFSLPQNLLVFQFTFKCNLFCVPSIHHKKIYK